jgi:glyoxylase-like metal-dependent hydrolase (beta-lactamase superfamily II)
MKFLNLAVLILAIVVSAAGRAVDSGKTTERTVTKLAEGIYTIRHKDAPDTFPQGNTTVVIGEREVLVVDSCYLPSSAREDIADIRRWTDKPVRYLVNTHWHFDHTMGNGTYAAAFPGLSIVAHIETARQSSGYNPGWFARFPKRGERMQQILDAGKDGNGKVLTEGDRKEYAEAIAGLEPVQKEFAAITDRSPNLTFDSELRLDLGNREVQIKWLGRGNTAGDAIIFLPKEKMIMTGDLCRASGSVHVRRLSGGVRCDSTTARPIEFRHDDPRPRRSDANRESAGVCSTAYRFH